jgi:hypothetical protein
MFKQIPGNHDYIVSLNGEIRKSSGIQSDLVINNGKITLPLYGKEETIDLRWLCLISFFEVKLPNYYKYINFVDCNPFVTKSHTGKIMQFTKTFFVKKGYKLIPNFPDYAISAKGDILDIISDKDLIIDKDQIYPRVYIYDPEKSGFRHLMVHRLVALAWISNSDYIAKPIVNHKDGNKKNYHYKNLEWCSYSENYMHAMNNGMIKLNTGYKIKDLKDNVVKTYTSFKKLCLDIGLHEETRFKNLSSLKRTVLVKDRYLIKHMEDNSPWLTLEEATVVKNKYTIEIVFQDGNKEVFYTTLDVMRRLKIWNISYNVSEIVRVAKIRYPGIKFNIQNNFVEKQVQALNLETMEVIEANSIREMSRKLNFGFSTIHKVVNSPIQYDCKGFVFRYKSEDPWETNYKRHPNSPKVIKAFNDKTSEELTFTSLSAVMKHFKVKYSLLKNRLENNIKLGDWVIKEILSLDK